MAEAAQVDLWGNEDSPVRRAKDHYGQWPITVWDCDVGDPFTQKLKRAIGDAGEARPDAFSDLTEGRTTFVYKGKVLTSVFNPAVAQWILNFWAPKKGVVFDPFAGGGTRAILAAAHGLTYRGIELRPEEVSATEARVEKAGVKAKIVTGDARDAAELFEPESADFLYTCPPYWNLEKYHGGEADLSMAPTYDGFLEGMRDCIEASWHVLKPGALSCWVLGMFRVDYQELIPLHHDITRLHLENGFSLKEEVVLTQRRGGAFRRIGNFEKGNRHLVRIHEYLMVYRRESE